MVEGFAYVLKIPEAIGLCWIVYRSVKLGLWVQRVRARGESIFSASWRVVKQTAANLTSFIKWRV